MTLKIAVMLQGKRAKKEERNNNYKNSSRTMNKMAIRTYILIIILNVNELNASIKRHRVVEWIKSKRPVCCLQGIHFRSTETHRLRMRFFF